MLIRMNILSKVAALAVLLPSCAWAQKSLNAQELFREVSASVVTVSGKNASGVSMQGSGVVIAPQVVVSNLSRDWGL
jgi:hypothetical protein